MHIANQIFVEKISFSLSEKGGKKQVALTFETTVIWESGMKLGSLLASANSKMVLFKHLLSVGGLVVVAK